MQAMIFGDKATDLFSIGRQRTAMLAPVHSRLSTRAPFSFAACFLTSNSYHPGFSENHMNYPVDVSHDIRRVQQWLKDEIKMASSAAKLKLNIAREIQKCLGDQPASSIRVAILSLVAADLVADPFNLSSDDEENARWLARDGRLGFDDEAPITRRYDL